MGRDHISPASMWPGARALTINQNIGGTDGYGSAKSSPVGADMFYGSFTSAPNTDIVVDNFPRMDWRDRTLMMQAALSTTDIRPGASEGFIIQIIPSGGVASGWLVNRLVVTGGGWDTTSVITGDVVAIPFANSSTGANLSLVYLYANRSDGLLKFYNHDGSARTFFCQLWIVATPQLNKRIILP